MTVILILFMLLCLVQVQFSDCGSIYEDYMSKHNTTAIQGVFVFLVFFRHYVSYISLSGNYDGFASRFNSTMGQLLVTMFLVYSGYGVMEAISRKGLDYVKKLPNKSLQLMFRFDLAVLLYLIVQIGLGEQFPTKRIILSFLCWDTIGNSNWYVFTMISLYLLTWLCFSIFIRRKSICLSVMFGLSILYVLVLKECRPNFWYNTVFCYPAGMIFSATKKSKLMQNINKTLYYLSALCCVLCGYSLFYLKRNDSCWAYLIWCCFFVALVVLGSMKIRINNAFLQFLGNHVFSIYILQRIPMILLQKIGLMNEHPYLSFVLSFVATLWGAILFSHVEKYIFKICSDIDKTKYGSIIRR